MNGIKYLLDTNILIGMYQCNKEVLTYVQEREINIRECAYSSITRIELLSFPKITPTEKQMIESLLNRMYYLAINTAIENEAIDFRYCHQTKLPDSIIAATARYYRLDNHT